MFDQCGGDDCAVFTGGDAVFAVAPGAWWGQCDGGWVREGRVGGVMGDSPGESAGGEEIDEIGVCEREGGGRGLDWGGGRKGEGGNAGGVD